MSQTFPPLPDVEVGTDVGTEQDEELIEDLGLDESDADLAVADGGYADGGYDGGYDDGEGYGDAPVAGSAATGGGRRPSTRTVLIAAIVGFVVALVLGVLAVLGLRTPDPGSADSTTTTASAGSADDGSLQQAAADLGAVHVQRSATPYTDATLAAQAGALVRHPGQNLDLDSDATTDLGALGTKAGVAACAAALGEADAPNLAVDLATFDGKPAAIVVATRAGDDAHTTAYAVGRDCATGDPQILRDGVPVS